MGGRNRLVAAVALGLLAARIALLLYGASTLPPRFAGFGLGNDARRFHDIARADGTPYRDFEVEIPPVAVGVVETLDGETGVDLAHRLSIAMLVCDVAVALLLWAGWGRGAALGYWVVGTPLAFFLYFRLDLLTVALTVAAFVLVKRRAQGAGGGLLAAAAFTKVWPVALVPLLAIERAGRGLLVAIGGVVLGAFAWIAWAGVDGPVQVLTFRGATGWEVESPIGFVVWRLSGETARMESGALRVGTVPGAVRLLLLAATIAGVAWAWWRTRDRPDLAEGYGAAVAVASLMIFSTLLSHQYLAWLLPWVAITESARLRLWTAIAGIGATATMLYTAAPVPRAFTVQLIVLFVRNLAIVAVLVFAVLELRARLEMPRPAARMSR